MKSNGDKSDLSISQAGTGRAALQCEDPAKHLPITQRPGPLETMDTSHNGELPAPGTENAPEGSSVTTQNEGSSQTVKHTEETEPKPMEIVKSQDLEVEKESGSKDLKSTDLSSDDEVKKDSSKKKSKKHKKHKSKKKKKKKKKEKNEKRSKSTSSVEDQENANSESKSAWKPVISTSPPREQDKVNILSSQNEKNVDALPSLSIPEPTVDSVKEHPVGSQLDTDSGFFGPKCPNEMHFLVSSNNVAVCEIEMQVPSKELAVDCQQNNENVKCTDENNEKPHTNCETAEVLQKEISLPQPGLALSEGTSVELEGSTLNSEESKDSIKQSDNTSTLLLQSLSTTASTSLLKSIARSPSRSNSLAREIRSRSKSLTKVPKKQANSKSLTRQRSRSSSMVRRQRSRSSSVGQRRRSKSKSPVRRRRSRSSTSIRYSKSPVRSWWSRSIKNRLRSVSIERRRRSRTRSLAKRRKSRSRSSEKGHHSRTRSIAKRRSRSRSANRRRKSRSTSLKRRLRSRSASKRKSKSAIRTSSKSRSPSRRQKSKSVSPLRRQKSKTSSPVRRRRSRSRSAVQKRRSRSGGTSRRQKSRSGSGSRRRRSRSSPASRRRKSRSGSAFRRRRSRSAIASRRRRTRSPSVSRRRKSRSPSVSRRRRTRSPSVSRRRRTRSPSVSRRRRTRSPSVSRRRRTRSPSVSRRRRSPSPSVSRRRRTRTPSVSRRRRTRSPSLSRRRRTRSPSLSRRRRTRSPSVSRRRRSRSPSVSRRRRTRSPSVTRRRRTRSPLVSRRRRSRSPSVSRRRSSRSPSISKRHRSRSATASRRRRSQSVSKRRKSRSASDIRRARSRSGSGTQRQKSQSYSATKRKSKSTSVAREEQSTLLSSASKVQSGKDKMSSSLERRSKSKEKQQNSRSRSGSVLKSTSVESEPMLQSKTSVEQKMPGTMLLDEKHLHISASTVESFGTNLSTVEKHEIKLPDVSSTSVTESKNSSYADNVVNMESSEFVASDKILDCSTISVLDYMKSTYSKSPTEQTISSNIPFNENDSTECDMDIEQTSSPTRFESTEQPADDVNMVEICKEAYEVDSNDHTEQHTKVVDLRIDNEQEQKTLSNSAEDGIVCKTLSGSSAFESTKYIKSDYFDKRSMVVPLELPDPTNSSCHDNLNIEGRLELANKRSDSVCQASLKAEEKYADHVTVSPSLKLSSTDLLPNCIEIIQESESIKCMKNADVAERNYLTQKGSSSSAVNDHFSPTVKQGTTGLVAESQMDSWHSSSTVDRVTCEGESSLSTETVVKGLDLLNNQENNMIGNLIPNESQKFPLLGSPSSILPASCKHADEDICASKLNDQSSNERRAPIKSLCLDKENLSMISETKEILEASLPKADLQRVELKLVKNSFAAEQNFTDPAKQSSSLDICMSSATENESTSSSVVQRYLLDNSSYKELVSNDCNLKQTGKSEVSQPTENKTIAIKPVKGNLQTASSIHVNEDLSTSQMEISNNLPVSSLYEMTLNTSPSLQVDKLNAPSLLTNKSESTSMEERSPSEIALQNISVSPNEDYHKFLRSKETTTLEGANIANLSAPVSPSKLCSSEENPECMSVTSVKTNISLVDVTEDTVGIQRPYEVLSNYKTQSDPADCKIISKPSPFNSMNDSSAKCEVLYGNGAQSESPAKSIPSSDREIICNFEKSNSRDQNSLTAICSEKQCSSTSKRYDGNLERVHLEMRENELSRNIVEHKASYTEIGETLSQSVSLSKDSESECFNGQERSAKSCTPGISSSLYVQQEIVSKSEERVNLEEASSIQSLTEVNQSELETVEQCVRAEPTDGSLRESKSLEDANLSPKPFLHETGRLSVPVQFKFSKTFKTLGVSQLCSTSEDSSDVESSKVNTSSSGAVRNTTASTSHTLKSSSKSSQVLSTSQQTDSVEPSKSRTPFTESSQDISTEPSQSDTQSEHHSDKDILQPDNHQAADDSQSGSSTKHTFPHISNAASKLGVKQRQYRSRSVAQDSRTPSVDRGRTSRSRSKSRRRRSHSKSSSRKKRSQSTSRKKSSHSKSVRRKRSRSRSRGRKRRSQSKSKGKKKRSTSKLAGKRKRSKSKSSERIGSSKAVGKHRSSRSTSKTRKCRLQSKSPEKKGRSRSKSEARKNLHSKTTSTRKRSRSKSLNRRRKSRSKSLSSRSRSRSVSASWKRFSHSKSSLHRKRSRSSSRSASPRRRSRSRNKRHSFSRSPAARSNSRSRSRWHRSRSRGRWRRSRSLSASRHRSRSTSRLSSSLSTKKRKSLSPVRRRRSRSQVKQKDKSPIPLSKRKSTSPPPPPQKKSVQPKPAGFKHSIGLKSLIQKQLSQAKSQGSTGKLSKEQMPLPSLTSRTQLSIFSTRAQASASNMSNIAQIPVPNLAEVPLPSVSAGSQIPMPIVPPTDPLSVSSLAAETQLSVPDLTTANQWHVPDMSSGAAWSVPDIAAGTQWSMADLGTSAQWPMSDLTAGSHWPMHDLTGAQWSMPDLAHGTQWAVPDVATGAQWAVPDLAAGTQWTVPDLTAGSQWAMTNLTAGAQWAVPDLAATAQWAVPDLTAGAQIQRADLAPEAQVPGSDLALEAQVPGSDLGAEAQVPGSDLAAEAQVPGSDMVAEAQLPPEHCLTSEEHNVIPDVAAEALVPVASSTFVPDVAAGIPLPDVAAAAQMPVPDVAVTIHMPDVATEAQKQMSEFASTQVYMSLSPEESVEDSHFGETIVSSEHQADSDLGDTFVQQSSFEPSVDTSQNLKMEETLSSVQQLPEGLENSQFSELNDRPISLDKPDLQLTQEPVIDIVINIPQVKPGIDSECPLSSETCRSSDVPFASCENTDYSNMAMTISSPVHSIHEESDPMHEHSLIAYASQSEPHVSSIFVESQTSPIQSGCVESNDDHDQPLLAVTNSVTDNLQVQPCNSSDHMLVEELYSKSVCSKWIAPYVSPDKLLQNELPVHVNITPEINSQSISDLNKIKAFTPNPSQQVELNTSLDLPHQTEPYTSPKQPQLVEPYTSPDHPQLVEPYASPIHPQLVEPYTSPQHPPLVELYSSPDHPQLVEPYASPDFPQLVEPYASPDRQQLVEAYTETEDAQICQPCISPVLTENICSPAEKSDIISIPGHTLTEETMMCTKMNTDNSCSDGSEIKDDSVTLEVPKDQDEVDSDYPQFSKLNDASVSLQEVPCPSPLKAYSLESHFSPKETALEVCSPTERQSETSTESHSEQSTSPAQAKQLCSPYPLQQDESFPISDCKPLHSFSCPDEPKLDSPFTTNQQVLGEEFVVNEHSQSKQICSIEEDFQPNKDSISSEQVEEKLYNIPVQSPEDSPSPSLPHTNEQYLNVSHEPLTEYDHPSAEDPMTFPEKNLCIPILSNTIISLHEDPSYTIKSLPHTSKQETITEHSHVEESYVATDCSYPDKLLASQVDKHLDKPSPSSDSVMRHDSQDSCSFSPIKQLSDCSNSFLSEHDRGTPTEHSAQKNESLDQTIQIDDSNAVFQSEKLSVDGYVENPLPTENSSVPAGLHYLNQYKLQYSTPDQASDLSVECMKHKLEDSSESIKADNHFTTTPPDLLPYDSEQPTDICSENSSEPVTFNSQPPPELLPYDSEQPASSFLSISDYSAEQGTSVFNAPPELLPYDSDQPIVLHNQQTEPSGEELPVYDSSIHEEPYKALDLPSVDSVKNSDNSASLNMHEIPEKYDTCNEMTNPEINFVKGMSSECRLVELPSSEQTFTSETLQEHSVPSEVVDCSQEYSSSVWSSTDEHLPAQELEEKELPAQQLEEKEKERPAQEVPKSLISRCEKQTEQIPLLKNISDPPEVQYSPSYEVMITSEPEISRVFPLVKDEMSIEIAKGGSPKSSTDTEFAQSPRTSGKTDSVSEVKGGHERSRSRSKDRKKSTSKSASQNKRSRSKSLTRAKKSRSKSLVKSRRIKSRSASMESSRRSSVVKRKESTSVVQKRSSRSPSVGRRRRSRSLSLSPRKRSRSSSIDRRRHRKRSPQSHQRHSRSPSRRRSHSPSVTGRRRSPSVTRKRRSRSPSVIRKRRSRSSSVTRKRRSRSPSITRKKSSPSPATRRRRSPSATRRRRTPSPPSTRRRRTPSPPAPRRRRSPSVTRRRRSPSVTRRRRSPSVTRRRRSPSVTRRRRSPSPAVTRRRRSPSPAVTRRRRSPSPAVTRRRRSPSPAVTRRRLSPSPAVTRRRRSPSPSASRRRRSPSSEFRRKRSPSSSVSQKRHSHSPSVPRKRRSRSTSISRKRRSRSASQRKRSRSSSPRKRRSKSKSPSKSPVGKKLKSDRSRSLSQSKVSRKRKTQSRSSSRDKKSDEKRRKRSSSKDSSKDFYNIKQRRKSRTPPRRKKSRSPVRRASVCKSPVRRRRSRSPIRRKSFSRSPIRRKRSRSRDKSVDSARSPKRLTDLDKAQLLEIAKANAAAMCAKAGVPLPLSLKPALTPATSVEEKITHRTYGVTIQELTEKCKQIAQSKEDDVIVNKPHDSDDEEEDRPFYNHPFKVSEHKPISFSLLNPSLKPAPKNQVTLTKEFPVSSGSQHRKKESDKVYGEWVPVAKNAEENKDDVFTNTGPAQPVDITSAMNERAVAQTRLTGNPYDIEALYMLNRAQEQIDAWAQSTSIPGQFTGSTGAQVLTAEEISNSGPQAWLKKDQFLKAAPVTGGRGALLMRKMGWKEGEGLGRNNEGNVDPIVLDFKTDRKGLVADGEKASNKLALPVMKDLSGKHPISALMELCNKKKWSLPEFELVDDTGPEHRKRFLFRVTVNGVLCQPSQPSLTKKLAKATAAAAALQALGALPKENMTSTSNFCSASTSTL
ncbi:hypothetical protein PRIEUP_LOCUS11903 [Pristimantis euphronides]